MDPDELKRKRLETLFRYGLGGIAAILISPLLFLVLKGIATGFALLAAGAFGFTAIQLAPVFSMKLANVRLGLIKGEARHNPIETMQNIYAQKTVELEAADQRIVTIDTKLRNYRSKLTALKQKYPEEAAGYDAIVGKMTQVLSEQKRQRDDSQKKLVKLAGQIDKAKDLYEMAKETNELVATSASARQQVYDQIAGQVAFDAVTEEVNRSFANLDLSLQKANDEQLALPAMSNPAV